MRAGCPRHAGLDQVRSRCIHCARAAIRATTKTTPEEVEGADSHLSRAKAARRRWGTWDFLFVSPLESTANPGTALGAGIGGIHPCLEAAVQTLAKADGHLEGTLVGDQHENIA